MSDNIVHIGDGVYISIDEDGTVELRVNDHRNPVVCTMEYQIFDTLVQTYNKFLAKQGREIYQQ